MSKVGQKTYAELQIPMKDLPIKCRNLSTVTLPINPEGDSEPLTWEECTAAREGL